MSSELWNSRGDVMMASLPLQSLQVMDDGADGPRNGPRGEVMVMAMRGWASWPAG